MGINCKESALPESRTQTAENERKMPKIAAVLLNYNDADAVILAAERIRGFRNIETVVLVDNASTDDSVKKLRDYAEYRDAVLVCNSENGGYGYGNNRGVDAARKEGCDYALIANPDAEFKERAVQKMAEALGDPDTAAAGALMEGARFTDCAWPLLDFWGELAYSGPFTKRLFRREIGYPRAFFKMLPRSVGAVHGSLMMVKIPAFYEAGGFDEGVFLYMEEKILGKRIAGTGKHIVLTDGVYRHVNSETMKKNGLDAVKRQKERQKAERFYYKNYLGAGFFQMLLVRLQQGIVLLETKLAAGKGKPG